MKYLSNAFSLQMLNLDNMSLLRVKPISADQISEEAISCIGHADTAAVVSTLLGRSVECNRASIHLEVGDVLYVAQVTGGRLPEGATTLPEGFNLQFLEVTLNSDCCGCSFTDCGFCSKMAWMCGG